MFNKILKNNYVIISFIAVFVLKLLLFIYNSPSCNQFDSLYTNYKGVVSEEWVEYCQKSENTCGMACLSFLLSKSGFEISESEISKILNKENKYISFEEMETVIRTKGLKSQSLEVDKQYFKAHPVVSILHFGKEHFIVFVAEYDKNEVIIFDPIYGKVYISWNKLLKKLDGRMFYVYK